MLHNMTVWKFLQLFTDFSQSLKLYDVSQWWVKWTVPTLLLGTKESHENVENKQPLGQDLDPNIQSDRTLQDSVTELHYHSTSASSNLF
jgi:hypothetical protein